MTFLTCLQFFSKELGLFFLFTFVEVKKMDNHSNIALFNDKRAMYSIQLRLNQNVFYRYCVVPSGLE